MSEADVRRANKKSWLNRLSAIVAKLVIALFLSIILEWLGIAFLWPEQGHLHSQQIMRAELQYLSEDFTRSLFYASPLELTNRVISTLYEWLFIKTGLHDWLSQPHHHSQWTTWLYHYGRAYIESIVYVTIIFVIRLFIILFTSPLFILAALAGFTEGLMMRDLRKFGAGRESGFVYHHARRFIVPTMLIAWIVYLSVPFSVHPNLILVPSAFLFALSICITSASFKKYL